MLDEIASTAVNKNEDRDKGNRSETPNNVKPVENINKYI